MRSVYDSEADALSIDLVDVDRYGGTEAIDDDYCTVAFANGRPANVELLSPRDHLELLELAAQRHGLDRISLSAAAHAALAAPDRVVVLSVGAVATA